MPLAVVERADKPQAAGRKRSMGLAKRTRIG